MAPASPRCCASSCGVFGAAKLSPASAAMAAAATMAKTAIRPHMRASCADGTAMVARQRGEEKTALAVGRFGIGDFNADPGQPDVGKLRRGQQPDRGNTEVLEDLRAEPDFAPLLGAGRIGILVGRGDG